MSGVFVPVSGNVKSIVQIPATPVCPSCEHNDSETSSVRLVQSLKQAEPYETSFSCRAFIVEDIGLTKRHILMGVSLLLATVGLIVLHTAADQKNQDTSRVTNFLGAGLFVIAFAITSGLRATRG